VVLSGGSSSKTADLPPALRKTQLFFFAPPRRKLKGKPINAVGMARINQTFSRSLVKSVVIRYPGHNHSFRKQVHTQDEDSGFLD